MPWYHGTELEKALTWARVINFSLVVDVGIIYVERAILADRGANDLFFLSRKGQRKRGGRGRRGP